MTLEELIEKWKKRIKENAMNDYIGNPSEKRAFQECADDLAEYVAERDGKCKPGRFPGRIG